MLEFPMDPTRPHRRESYWVVLDGAPHKRTKPDSGVGHPKPVAKGEVVSGQLEEVSCMSKEPYARDAQGGGCV